MTTRTPAARRPAGAVAAVLTATLAVTLAACGGDPTTGASSTAAGQQGDGGTGDDVTRMLVGALPDPVPDRVLVDGTPDVLTRSMVLGPADRPDLAFRNTTAGRGITVRIGSSGAERAFERLCIGQVDVVDSSVPITAAQWAQCRTDGLDVVQFQVAADAVVVATRSETDVGTDCLSTAQLAGAFGHGSDVERWDDLGADYDDAPFGAVAPGVTSVVTGSFASDVLGDPAPVADDFRTDLVATADQAATRDRVAGTERDRVYAQRFADAGPVYHRLVLDLRTRRAHLGDVRQALLAARSAQRRSVRTGRSAAVRAAADARVGAAQASRRLALSAVETARMLAARARPRYLLAAAAQRRLAATRGVVGLFSQGFYTTYEGLLRPFEIEAGDPADDAQNCIFPSAQTILDGQYPLARRLLLTVTTRSLRRPEVRAFVEHYLERSRAGAVEQGLVPLPVQDVRRQVAWLTSGHLPTFASVDGGPVEQQTDAAAPSTAPTTIPPGSRPAR